MPAKEGKKKEKRKAQSIPEKRTLGDATEEGKGIKGRTEHKKRNRRGEARATGPFVFKG